MEPPDDNLRQENKKLKARLRGVEALGTLLHDSRQEAASLRQKVSRLENAIRPRESSAFLEKDNDDQRILDENPSKDGEDREPYKQEMHVAAGDLSSSVEYLPESFPAQEEEEERESSSVAYPVVRRPVATIKPPLSTELMQLSQEYYSTTIASSVAAIASKVNKLEKELETRKVFREELEKENMTLKNEISILNHELEKSNRSKNAVISELRQNNKQAKQEVSFLKEQLEIKEKRELHSYEYVTKKEVKEIPLGKEGMSDRSNERGARGGLEAYMEQLESKVKTLETEKKELIKVNHQWDNCFRSTKEKMDSKIQDLESELVEKTHHLRLDEDSQFRNRKDTDIALLTAKERIEAEKVEKERALQEAKAERQRAQTLQHQYDLILVERREMGKEIGRLNEMIKSEGGEKERKQQEDGKALYELKMESEALKHQVEVYKLDFESERRDRERTVGELDRVRSELKKLREPTLVTGPAYQQSKVNAQRRPHYYQTSRQQETLYHQPSPAPPTGGAFHDPPPPLGGYRYSPLDLQQQAYQQQQQRFRRHLIPRDNGGDVDIEMDADVCISYPPIDDDDNTNYIHTQPPN